MPGISKNLPVPYFIQPTGNTCQSTVLKMMATYLEQNVVLQSTGAANRAIGDIWTDINRDPRRPDRVAQNAHANMKWWLERHFPSLRFVYLRTAREDQALVEIVRFIDRGFPVLVSVSHARSSGHIILVTGYANYTPDLSGADFELIVHDPYGRFDPWLLSKMFGSNRWTGGSSLMGGGQLGPGRMNRLPIPAVGRRAQGSGPVGNYILLSVSR
jgi:hypothetical protein